jgi:DNA-binding transcriptional ArsR family regulator
MLNEENLSPEKLEQVAFILKTIAHPTRIAVISILKNGERLSVNEICEKLGGAEQSLTSHHLSNMKLKGVLGSERKGRNIYYFLKLDEVIKVINCVESCNIPSL